MIINYDLLGKHIESLKQTSWSGIVFDEAHYLKNHTSQRSRFARQLLDKSRGKPGPVVHALTGTPLSNRPRDLFPLLQVVDHSLGRSFLSFAKRYYAAYHNGFGWVADGASHTEELSIQLHGVMLRRTKGGVLSLPPKVRTWLPVDIPEGIGAKQIGAVLRTLIANSIAGSVGSVNSVSARSQQMDRARILAALTTARRQLAVAKSRVTIDFVEGAVAQGEKVLVFSCFDEPLKRIQQHFGPDTAVLLMGATAGGRRQALVDRFQADPKIQLFIANIQAGGVGLNFTAARQVVFNDLDWVPANHWQAEDRAYRIGQTATVNVTYMVGRNSVDEFVERVLEAKAALVDAIIEGKAVELSTDVLTEIERVIARLSPQLADYSGRDISDQDVQELLRKAADLYKTDFAYSDGAAPARPTITEADLRLLASVLAGPRSRKFSVASHSKPGQSYELEVDSSGDVSCGCPGFTFRGMCTHARQLKASIAQGGQIPDDFRPVV